MYISRHNAGYSLVEVLVAISILMISIVGPLTIASKGLKNASFAREQNIAFFLAQEGLESIIQKRYDNALRKEAGSLSTAWGWVDDITNENCSALNACGVTVDNNNQIFECVSATSCNLFLHDTGRTPYRHESGGEVTPYARELFFTVDPDVVYVRSVVSWNDTDSVELETYLYNIYD